MELSTNLSDQFTILMRIRLPENLSEKKREALDGWRFGVEVASDRGSPPAQFAGYEVRIAWMRPLLKADAP